MQGVKRPGAMPEQQQVGHDRGRRDWNKVHAADVREGYSQGNIRQVAGP